MNKIDKNKLILPIAIMLGCVVLGSSLYLIQVNKQKSIERQEQIDLQVKIEADQTKVEQERKEYLVKRTKDCYDYETSERKKFNNIDGSFYNEEDDVCTVRYVDKKWKEGDPNSCDLFEKIINKTSTCTIEHFFTKDF